MRKLLFQTTLNLAVFSGWSDFRRVKGMDEATMIGCVRLLRYKATVTAAWKVKCMTVRGFGR